MPEIARCPVCGEEPEVWCRDEAWRIRITCCRHVVYSTDGWNRYAAAMTLAEALAWKREVEDFIASVLYKRKTVAAALYLVDISNKADEILCNAEARMREVFK